MDNNPGQDTPNKGITNPLKQFEFKANKEKMSTNIILQSDNQQFSGQKSFTPTRKPSLIKNYPHTSSSQYAFTQQFSYKSEEKTKLQQIISKINQLENRVKKLQKIQAKINQAKRIRRKSCEIAKLYTCPEQACRKNYGTQTALKKHVQIKHSKKAIFKIQDQSE